MLAPQNNNMSFVAPQIYEEKKNINLKGFDQNSKIFYF